MPPKALATNNITGRDQRRPSGLPHNHSHHFCVCWECKLHAKQVHAKISFFEIPGLRCPGRCGARTGMIRPEACPSQARPCPDPAYPPDAPLRHGLAPLASNVCDHSSGGQTHATFALHNPWCHGSIVRGTWALLRRARGPFCRRARSLAVSVQARLRVGRGRSTQAPRLAT